jgi:predicted dienelactone hydrolase
MNRTLKRTLVSLPVALLSTLALLLTLNTTGRPDMPATGYHKESLSLPNRNEPVTVHIWYPTAATGPTTTIGENALFWGFPAYPDTTPTPGPHPIVIMSHGSGGKAFRHLWLATRLAAAGFIVIAPDHPGSTSGDSDPAKTLQIWDRPADISALIDWISTSPPVGLQPDLAHIGTFGFSMGGFAVMASAGAQVSLDAFNAYCDTFAGQIDCGWYQAAGIDLAALNRPLFEQNNSDPRISATVAVDPALSQAITPASLSRISNPVLVLNLGSVTERPAQMDASQMAAQLPNAQHRDIPGAVHFSAMDSCRLLGRIIIGLAGEDSICADTGGRSRATLQAEIGPLILTYFKNHLVPA